MGNVVKKGICLLLACMLALPLHSLDVHAADANEDIVDVLEVTERDAIQNNYFSYTSYFGKDWTVNASEAYIDLGSSDERAGECYYEIHFKGSGIEVLATKASTHGKVAFSVDGGEETVVDLYYNGNRVTETVYSVSGLAEGEHTLKAVTQKEKSGSKIVNQVAGAKITHKPYTGGTPNLGGTIADTNMQYTKSSYGAVAAQNTNSARLSAWKNDKAVSEIVLYSKNCSLDNVSITAGDLTGSGGTIPADQVKTTFIKTTKAYNGAYLGYGDPNRAYPEDNGTNRSEASDILYQEGGAVDIGWNSVQPVWVEFNVPEDTKEGVYTGSLTATADGIEQPLTFTYTLTVQNMTLPSADTYKDTFDIELWQYPYSSAEYYDVEPFSEKHLKSMESSMQIYKEMGGHAITASIVEEAWNGQTYSKNDIHYPSMVKWTKSGDGFTYDYTDFDKWVEFCKELGIGDKIVLYSIAPWHNSFTYWENGTMKKEAFTAGSDRYKAVWKDFLEDLIAHLEEKGWFEEAYIGIDERGFSAAAFDVIDSVTNSQGESLKTAGAMDAVGSKRELAMRVDDLNVGDNAAAAHADEFAQLLADRKAAGLRTTLYSCTEHKPGNFTLSAPGESYWSIMNAAKEGTTGFLRWAYDAWVEDPLRDTTHNAFEAGDCFLIYPDEKDAANPTSKRSVRLEKMAEAIRDVNKLIVLKQEAPELSGEIERLYEAITISASTGRTYLTDQEKTRVAQEVSAFQKGVSDLTSQYLASTGDGLHVLQSEKELKVGESWEIPVKLSSDKEDKTIIYKSEDTSVASVDARGNVTARAEGSTTIKLKNKASGYAAIVTITVVKKELNLSNKLTEYKLPENYLSDVAKGESTDSRHYLGQPDMVMLDDEETLITAYPTGHGIGSIEMSVSRDGGESWAVKEDIPESWSRSRETPTMYKLDFTNGDRKLILISGRPSWGDSGAVGGWDTSISEDGGETWSEYKRFHETLPGGGGNYSVVAMASLIQMRDEDGNPIDKWMGVYHDLSYVNYKTYLTFDENGEEQWTAPERYLSEYRNWESTCQICEVGLFRSPDGKRIVGLARSQSHNNLSTMFYSDDEGETWSEPVYLPGSLAGERHKILYDPTDPEGQRVVIPFREIKYDLNGNNQFDGGADWLAGDWVAWVGTYDDIMNQREGSYRILLCEDWSANAKSGDTGYTGFVVKSDGTFIMDTYGHWDKEYSESLPNYNVHNDWCWIKQAKFKLSDLDESIVPDLQEKLGKELEKVPAEEDSSLYTRTSWRDYKTALEEAKRVQSATETTQDECNTVLAALRAAYQALVVRGADTIDEPDQPGPDEPGPDEPENPTPENPTPENPTPEEPKPDQPGGGNQPSGDGTPAPQPQPGQDNQITEGAVYPVGDFDYQVISNTDLTVAFVKTRNVNLKKIVVGDTVPLGGKTYKITSIAASAFKNCKKATSAVIGKNVVTIGASAFEGCKKLKKVTIHSTQLQKIGKKAFKNCKKLKSIIIKSKSLKTVEKDAFKGMPKNAKIKAPAAKKKAYAKILAKGGKQIKIA